ncbi:transcriptional regulator with XRE-family HTH domain [Chryseobacterium sp. PvR013]|uniref:helix-turn-helix domain-containing protein n=1 Tax=Chryseobacterium sp. PvR013 TaxID=2806595 RepID=UPI001AEB02AD|nr:helix-turn-helix transcriptional regulator [Chryseobacterium sp. PvR013]MBP1164914.1 transcriptional regulator with XRE-family HTH domain [Chryseobacterium sp. PvR013]
MEKLRNLRKQRGYTQEYMSNIISTDVSNYSRKENDEVRIFDDEWEKLAKALDVPVEEIKEERKTAIVHNNHDNTTFNDNAGSYFNNFHSIPDSIVENLQSYIKVLEEQVEALKEENKKFKSR